MGTDLKFHWVRHDEDDAPAAEAAPVGGGVGAGGGRDGEVKPSGAPARRGTAADKLLQKRKVLPFEYRSVVSAPVCLRWCVLVSLISFDMFLIERLENRVTQVSCVVVQSSFAVCGSFFRI